MGYRSDVGWACDPAVAEVIDAVLELNPKESNPDIHSLVDETVIGVVTAQTGCSSST